MEEFSIRVIDLIASVPEGMVSSYGRIAAMAGSPRGARQVVRLLHSSGSKFNLPWQRIVAADGSISLPDEKGDLQRALLVSEGVSFTPKGKVDLKAHLWNP